MSNPIRKQGETLAQAIERTTGHVVVHKEKLQKKDKEVKALKEKVRRYERMASSNNAFPEELICRECQTSKPREQFKIVEIDVKLGICKKCDREGRLQTERMRETEKATDKATEMMAKTISDIDRLFSRHKLPLEKNVIGDILIGTTEIVRNLQTTARYSNYNSKAEPVIGINSILNERVVWPLVLYTYTITGFNQVKTAKILGISRNTLRDRMMEIEKQRPSMITLYRCEENWPNFNKTKVSGYLEMDPALEVRREEIAPSVRIIDSSISG